MQTQHTLLFEEQRERLVALAYRMLGSAADAQDIVQDAWLRFVSVDLSTLENAGAMLSTIVTRLCLDRLQSARMRREEYPGIWLPEPILHDMDEQSPGERVSRAESVTFAFLRLLDTLSPLERAVFLMRDVFDYTFEEIAHSIERTEASCRQLHHRARTHVEQARPRFNTSPAARTELLQRFLSVCATGDLHDLESLLTRDVVVYSDGGGKASAARKPVHGTNNVARMMLGFAHKADPLLRYEFLTINAAPALLLRNADGSPNTLLLLDDVDGQVSTIWLVRNPDKLCRLLPD